MTYFCKKCQTHKDDNEFYVRQSGKIASPCKPCTLKMHRLWEIKNPGKKKKTAAIWKLNNRDKLLMYNKMGQTKRRLIVARQTPEWANIKAIKDFYLNCPKGMTVDHVLPLNGADICGLHIEYNLQYLTKSANSKKHTKWSELEPSKENIKEIFCN